MPVRKYHSIEEMPDSWEYFGDRNKGGRLRFVLASAALAGPLGMPRGVFKFRSADEAYADRERYEQARIDRLRKTRHRP